MTMTYWCEYLNIISQLYCRDVIVLYSEQTFVNTTGNNQSIVPLFL